MRSRHPLRLQTRLGGPGPSQYRSMATPGSSDVGRNQFCFVEIVPKSVITCCAMLSSVSCILFFNISENTRVFECRFFDNAGRILSGRIFALKQRFFALASTTSNQDGKADDAQATLLAYAMSIQGCVTAIRNLAQMTSRIGGPCEDIHKKRSKHSPQG